MCKMPEEKGIKEEERKKEFDGIRYSTGVKTIHLLDEDTEITEDFYIPVSVPAPPECDKLFVSNYGTVMSEIKEEELERAIMWVKEEGEIKEYTTG